LAPIAARNSEEETMIPLNERIAYSPILPLSERATPSTADRAKFLERLTLFAEASDALAELAARNSSDAGSVIRLRAEEVNAFARFLVDAVIAAPEEFISREIRKLKAFIEKDLEAAAARERAREANDQSALDQRWAVEAKQMSIVAIFAEIERTGIRLSLAAEDGDRIVCKGGNLDPRHKIWLATRRRDAVLVLRDREHAARVAEVV
jgi:hypothetical protein